MATRRTAAEDSGAFDREMTEYASRLEAQYRPIRPTGPTPSITGMERMPSRPGGPAILRIHGSGFSLASMGYLNGQPLPTRFLGETSIEVELPDYAAAGAAGFGQILVSDGPPPSWRLRIGAADVKRPPLSVTPDPETPKAGQPFSLVVKFASGRPTGGAVIHLEVTYPNGEEKSGYFRVSAREARAGEKVISPFVAGSWGAVKVCATLYTSDGNATAARVRFDAVPVNPMQVSVFPQYSAFTWKGAAQYNSGEGRYYCYARAVFSNGNNFAVTVNRTVQVRVTDGGSQVTTFSFYLSSATVVPANSSRTIYFYTRHRNSATADILANFGDVTMTYTFSTAEGNKTGSAVFIMMGQIKVACNFVGSFSSSERTAVRNLVLGRASSIYEKVDLAITSAPILEIPSPNSDWSRFRDIRIDNCKNGVTSDEAGDMRSGWSSPDSHSRHIDLWFVESFSGESCASSLGGFSPQPGPASKNGRDSGVVIDVKDLDVLNSTWGSNVMGILVAHELGHYLGLPHHGTSSNFMAASTGGSNMDITWDQHNIVDDHDWVQKLNL